MFTGIIEQAGTVLNTSSTSIEIDAKEDSAEPWKVGESIAVNGCCLTVVKANPLKFELSEETLRKTAHGDLRPGSIVNIERAMKAGARFGGHVVQGHVDATGTLESVRQTPQAHVMRFRFPADLAKYVVEKGSVAIDGISLTVVGLSDGMDGTEFETWIIPHTWEETNLSGLKPGSRVNLEFDMIAKYVERLVAFELIRPAKPK